VALLSVADLFCGTGGFSNGFEQTGVFRTALGIDIKPASIETFAANHRHALAICEDIREIGIRDLADKLGGKSLDVILAGPPCQGFSSIRPYRSINENDPRNSLFEQMVLHVEFFRPHFVVFENVVGLLHHKRGATIGSIKEALQSLGYSADIRVLNAVHFGVPQKRERVVLIARRGRVLPRFPEPTHHYNGKSMAGKLASSTPPLFSLDLPPALAINDAISDLPPVSAGGEATEYPKNVVVSEYANARRNGCQRLTLHSSTKHTSRMLEIIRHAGSNRWALPEGLTTSGFSSSYSRLDGDQPSTTITVNFVHPASNRCIHPIQDRALTPREGARIQSFDDDFEFRGSRTEIVKQIGEAVPPLLGRAIADAVLAQW